MPTITQGYWEYRTRAEAGGPPGIYTNYYHDEDVMICGEVRNASGKVLWPIVPADGRIMAAAPELLQGCEAALDYITQHSNGQSSLKQYIEIEDRLRNAIAKACSGVRV